MEERTGRRKGANLITRSWPGRSPATDPSDCTSNRVAVVFLLVLARC